MDADEDEDTIPRERIHFTPLGEEVFKGFDQACKKFHPEMPLRIFECDVCDFLHVELGDTDIMLAIPSSMWEWRH